MANLPKLQDFIKLIKDDFTPTLEFQNFWSNVIKQVEQSLSDLAATISRVTAVEDGKQPKSDKLTSISSLDGTLGLVEQTGTDSFSKRAIGVSAGTSIPATSDADSRYVRQDQGASWAAATGTEDRTSFAAYAGQTVSSPPTQAEVQAIDNQVKAISQRLVALINDLKSNGTLT